MISTNTVSTVLLVEDNAMLMKVMLHWLKKDGYKCITAESALEALEILNDELPDIILSDYMMPVMDGFTFRQTLLQNPVWKDIPFVFLTSFADNEMVLKGLELNALDYIDKETPIPVILSKLRNLLGSLHNQHERSVMELRQAAEALNVKSFPSKLPVLSNFSINFWHKGYQDYPGGDFIDFVKVDERYCFVVLGDIMGKKWKAWFFTFGFLSYIRAAIRFCILDHQFKISEIVQKINKLACEDETLKDILSSLSLLLIDNDTGQIMYCGAGDLPLIYYNAENENTKTFSSSGLLLGFMDDGLYDEQIIEMKNGDELILFTDGLIDIVVSEKKKSDYSIFYDKINPFLGAENSFENIQQIILEKITGQNQLDDASIIFIKKK